MIKQWPEKMEGAVCDALVTAGTQIPALAEWPEGTKLLTAPEVERIGGILVAKYHEELKNARIAYLFREKIAGRNVEVWAKASRASARIELFGQVDFMIDVNWTVWKELTVQAKAALIDHELEHCGVDDDERFCMLPHDLEEFYSTVRRWGLWRPSVHNMGQVMKAQLEMGFEEAKAVEASAQVPAGAAK